MIIPLYVGKENECLSIFTVSIGTFTFGSHLVPKATSVATLSTPGAGVTNISSSANTSLLSSEAAAVSWPSNGWTTEAGETFTFTAPSISFGPSFGASATTPTAPKSENANGMEICIQN